MVVLGCNSQGFELKEIIKEYLHELEVEVLDVSDVCDDFYEASIKVVQKVLENKDENKGIIIDEYGIGPFMVACKHKYIICAQCNDEHSAKMTRDHNNSNVITLGSEIVGSMVAKSIVKRFVNGKYAGGRHQIRVDMLDKMG